MGSLFHLPSKSDGADKYDIGAILTEHHEANASLLNRKLVSWLMTHYYLLGYRGLQAVYDSSNMSDVLLDLGIPEQTHRDGADDLVIRVEKAMLQIQAEIGRAMQIDVSPAVKRRVGNGLALLRRESGSYAMLTDVYKSLNIEEIKASFYFCLIAFGTVGITWDYPSKGRRWKPSAQVIAPWELTPLPSEPMGLQETGGYTWASYVPYEWLKTRIGLNLPTGRSGKDFELLKLERGDAFGRPRPVNPPRSLSGNTIGGPRHPGEEENSDVVDKARDYVHLKRHYITDPARNLTRLVIQAGDLVIQDIDYEDEERLERNNGELSPCPVQISRYLTITDFYGRSFAERVIPAGQQLEKAIGAAVQQLDDRAKLTFAAVPLAGGYNIRAMQSDEFIKNKVMFVAPDPNAPNMDVRVVSPTDTGEAQLGLSRMLDTIGDGVAGQGQMYFGASPSGRADSGSSLSIINANSNVPFATVSTSIVGAFVGLWRVCNDHIRSMLEMHEQEEEGRFSRMDFTLKVHAVNSSILGVKFDVESGSLKLTTELLPHSSEVEITVGSLSDDNKADRLQKLLMLRKNGDISEVDFQIAAVIHDMGFPYVNPAYAEDYLVADTENVLLFGDGQTPGIDMAGGTGMQMSDEAENPLIHLACHKSVMRTIWYKLASPEVHAAFYKHIKRHEAISLRGTNASGVTFSPMAGLRPQNPEVAGIMGQQAPGAMDMPQGAGETYA